MPIFEYTALTDAGKATKGVVDADTPKAAREKLRERRVHVTSMKAIGADAEKATAAAGGLGASQQRFTRLFGKAGFYDITLMTRQFSTLLAAGIALSDALNALIDQTENDDLQTTLRDVREKVTQGKSLADALAAHPRYFNDLYVNMIRAGEASGTLDEILARLARYMEKQNRVRGKVTNALTYPAVMVLFGTAVVIFLITNVIPRMAKMLTARGNVLPVPTQILLGVSDFLRDWGLLLLAAIVVGTMLFRLFFLRTDHGRLWWDTVKLGAPIFGPLFKKQAVSRFAVTFATLLRSGIPAMECLGILKEVVDNRYLSKTIEEVRARILEGADIATPLKKSRIFPPVVGYMVAVGEQSGHLEEMLEKIAEAYDEEIELTTQRMTTLIEPIIIIALSGVVMLIIMAVILPMLQISKL